MGECGRNRARRNRTRIVRNFGIEGPARDNSSASGTRYGALDRSRGDGPKAERSWPKQRRRFQCETAQFNGATIEKWACLAAGGAPPRRVKKLKRTCRSSTGSV